jgi:hypothetical protein
LKRQEEYDPDFRQVWGGSKVDVRNLGRVWATTRWEWNNVLVLNKVIHRITSQARHETSVASLPETTPNPLYL